METALQQEVRQHPLTGRWIAYAPGRARRPNETALPDPPANGTPAKGCPFCAGHEAMLPPMISETAAPGAPGWSVRVVPNKYPALTPEQDAERFERGPYRAASAYGRQEVIIETPNHHAPLACLSSEGVEAVVDAYLQRYHAIRQDDERLIPFLFRNHGADAGASLSHPHSQLIATMQTPPDVQHEEAQALRHHEETGECFFCATLDHETAERERIVLETDAFVAFVPYAAEVPCEIWLVPRRHRADFGDLSDEERPAFAGALRATLARLRQQMNDPDYNFFIRSSLAYGSEAEHLHWYVRIVPRTTKRAGFELGTGMNICPSLPEEDAAFLRG